MPSKLFPSSKGRFITLEGGEGVGKTTLIRSLGHELEKRGLRALLTHQPGATELGKKLRNLLLDQSAIKLSPTTELLLFLADKSQHIHEMIKPALDTYDFVICDRYLDSAFAYQKGYFQDRLEQFHNVCSFATESLVPDMTLVLDMDPQEGKKRILSRGSGELDTIEQKDMVYHESVRNAFLSLAQTAPDRCRVLDANASKEALLASTLELFSSKEWI